MNRLAISLLVGLWAVTPGWVNALPTDGQVVPKIGGVGTITQSSKQDMVIKQETSKLIINWQTFNIGSKESVTFQQPDFNSVALNRVIGVDPSIIAGRLSANGQVFLTNPSGVIFRNGSKVDVHGLLATTLNISNGDFLKGNFQFSQGSGPLAAIINKGNIHATRYVGLLAPEVKTDGSIVVVADLGSIALASGTAATLDFNGDGLISFVVTDDAESKVLQNQVNNSKLIRANEGQVLLTAKSAGDVIGNVVNHSGIIKAQTVQQKDGKIILSRDPGTVKVSGMLDAPNVFITGDVVAVAANKFLSTNNGDTNITANHLDLKGDLNSGTGDVSFTLADGGDLNIEPGNNPRGSVGSNDIRHIIAENLILKTDGDINVKGLAEKDTDGITDSVILESGGDINFVDVASTFPAVKLFAINDINVNTDVTTTKTDFIAVADSENNGRGDFNVAPDAAIISARDIDISAVNINAADAAFGETRDLILNGNSGGPQPPPIDTNSVQQGSLSSFLTDFFQNGGSDC